MTRRAKLTKAAKPVTSRSSGLATGSVWYALDHGLSFRELKDRIAALAVRRELPDTQDADAISGQLDRAEAALRLLSTFFPRRSDDLPATTLLEALILERLKELLDAIELICIGGIVLGFNLRGNLADPANRKKSQQLQAMQARAAKARRDAGKKAKLREIIGSRLGKTGTGQDHKDAASILSEVNADLKRLGMREIAVRTIARHIAEMRILKERRRS
jgi:hypothetical protein